MSAGRISWLSGIRGIYGTSVLVGLLTSILAAGSLFLVDTPRQNLELVSEKVDLALHQTDRLRAQLERTLSEIEKFSNDPKFKSAMNEENFEQLKVRVSQLEDVIQDPNGTLFRTLIAQKNMELMKNRFDNQVSALASEVSFLRSLFYALFVPLFVALIAPVFIIAVRSLFKQKTEKL